MPIHHSKTQHYYQYGRSGTKYYYRPGHALDKALAKRKAERQQRAIHVVKKKK